MYYFFMHNIFNELCFFTCFVTVTTKLVEISVLKKFSNIK